MNLIVAALATWQIVEIWHHSLLFAPWRVHTEMWTGKLGELLTCPWCLSVWVGMLCSLVLYAQEFCELSQGGSVVFYGFAISRLVLHGFAVSRLANLGNDYFKAYCRTPKLYHFESSSRNSIG